MLINEQRTYPKGFTGRLNAICRRGVYRNRLLSTLSTWQIGGPADYLVVPDRISKIQKLLPFLRSETIPFIVIGAGSNLLFSDKGFRGVVILIGAHLAYTQVDGQYVTVQAGAWAPCFSRMVAKSNLSGAEHMVGIPGSIGGLICMDGGSDRKSISDNITEVTSVNVDGLIIKRKRSACEFDYRRSCFQTNNEIIVEAELIFEIGNYRESRKKMLSIMASRRSKFPLKSPCCGSVFLSNPAYYEQYGPPGRIIDRLGLKGKMIGSARVSEKHANFIVHNGDATANDVLSLVHFIRKEVAKQYQINLTCEARYVSSTGNVKPLHLVSAE